MFYAFLIFLKYRFYFFDFVFLINIFLIVFIKFLLIFENLKIDK
jgi:hypothetical protein